MLLLPPTWQSLTAGIREAAPPVGRFDVRLDTNPLDNGIFIRRGIAVLATRDNIGDRPTVVVAAAPLIRGIDDDGRSRFQS